MCCMHEQKEKIAAEKALGLMRDGKITSVDELNEKYEKEKRKEEVIELLNQEEKPSQYLDLGESDGIWYYGFILDEREVVVTSNGDVLRNTLMTYKDKQGEIIEQGKNQIEDILKLNYNSYIGDIAPIISRNTVKRFLESANSLIKPKELYKQIRDKILYYMDFSGQDEIADVLTCWTIGTYCYPLFYWYPHLLFNAPSQSGKSKCAFITMQLGFRGFDLGASAGVTPAQVFRTLEGNRGTILIDEFELAEGKNASDTQRLVNQIINASATRDAYVIRAEQIDKKWKAWKFPIFCPKIVCNITGINPTSLSRFIAFKWLKTNSEKGKRKPYREKDKKSFEPIREDLYIFMLENWSKIKAYYEGLDLPDLKNREEDNWLPIFAIARFIDSLEGEPINAEEQLKKYLESYQDIVIETHDNTEDFFRLLYENVSEDPTYYAPKDIADMEGICDLLSFLKSPAHWIGKKLKEYKFKQYRLTGKRCYLLSKVVVGKIIELYYTNTMIPNDTIVNNDHNDHNVTKETKQVSLGDIHDIIPEDTSGVPDEER